MLVKLSMTLGVPERDIIQAISEAKEFNDKAG
jgi:hypothetical protein